MRTRQWSTTPRLVALVATMILGLGGAAMTAGTAAADAPGATATAATQTWIVTLANNVDAASVGPALASQRGGRLLSVYTHVLDGFAFAGSADAAAALAQNPRVARVELARGLHAVEIAPNGILRTSAWAAHQAGYTGVTSGGAPVHIAIVDTGIKLDHVDLVQNIDAADGVNCIDPGQPPNDDHGHGTHVAGTAAAAFNGEGVVGMATDAKLIPIKVLNSTGFGTDAQVICGLDHVAAVAEAKPGPYVVNMSLGDPNRPNETTCDASALHQAICNLTAKGVTVVAAAGNDGADAAGFVPAAYDEVIAVSAFADFDGQRSFAGCQMDFSEYGYQCDDNLADFSNYGSVIDVTAPGVHIQSDWIDGGTTTLSGTSMAAPHVAGAAALVLASNPSLTPAQVRAVLQSTGECPDGGVANGPTCVGHGQWQVGGLFGDSFDKDGIPEPLVNALRAAQAAGTPPPRPTATATTTTTASTATASDTAPPVVSLTAPPPGATLRGTVSVSANASDNVAVARVDFSDGSTLIGSDSTAPYAVSWTTGGDGPHTVTATAYDTAGLTSSDTRALAVDNTSPTIAVTSPGAGNVAGTVTLGADSSDPTPGSGVASVQFFVDGTGVATDTTAPYQGTWNSTTTSNGPHTITARATDAVGNTATSAAVTVNVNNAVPTVVLTITRLSGHGQTSFFSWTSWVDVNIADHNGNPIAGAVVTFGVTGGAATTRSCTTSSSGNCSTSNTKVSVSNKKSSVTYTTTNVAKAGATWDGDRWAVTLRLR